MYSSLCNTRFPLSSWIPVVLFVTYVNLPSLYSSGNAQLEANSCFSSCFYKFAFSFLFLSFLSATLRTCLFWFQMWSHALWWRSGQHQTSTTSAPAADHGLHLLLTMLVYSVIASVKHPRLDCCISFGLLLLICMYIYVLLENVCFEVYCFSVLFFPVLVQNIFLTVRNIYQVFGLLVKSLTVPTFVFGLIQIHTI